MTARTSDVQIFATWRLFLVLRWNLAFPELGFPILPPKDETFARSPRNGSYPGGAEHTNQGKYISDISPITTSNLTLLLFDLWYRLLAALLVRCPLFFPWYGLPSTGSATCQSDFWVSSPAKRVVDWLVGRLSTLNQELLALEIGYAMLIENSWRMNEFSLHMQVLSLTLGYRGKPNPVSGRKDATLSTPQYHYISLQCSNQKLALCTWLWIGYEYISPSNTVHTCLLVLLLSFPQPLDGFPCPSFPRNIIGEP